MSTERQLQERNHVASVLRSQRLRHGWSVSEAAQRIGVDQSSWSKWENSTTMPRPTMLQALGELLELPDDWMVPPTLSHPAATVDDRLARIEQRQQAILDEIVAERERIEQLYQQLRNGAPDAKRPNRNRPGGSGPAADPADRPRDVRHR